MRNKNCLAEIFALRHQDVSSGPLGCVPSFSRGHFNQKCPLHPGLRNALLPTNPGQKDPRPASGPPRPLRMTPRHTTQISRGADLADRDWLRACLPTPLCTSCHVVQFLHMMTLSWAPQLPESRCERGLFPGLRPSRNLWIFHVKFLAATFAGNCRTNIGKIVQIHPNFTLGALAHDAFKLLDLPSVASSTRILLPQATCAISCTAR